MLKLFEKWVGLAIFLLFTSIFAATSAVAEQSILAGANDIIIGGDVAGKTLEDVKGTCSLIISAFVYDTKVQPAKFVPVHIYGDPPYSRRISEEAVGKGLRVVSAENCKLAASGAVPYLGRVSRLDAGWNLIGVSAGIAGKSFDAVKGTCEVEKVRFYSPEYCKYCGAAKDDPELSEEQRANACETPCDGDFSIIDLATPLSDSYLGKGIWMKVTSDCILDDGTPAEVLCNEAECASKSGCIGNDYKTFGCQNKECIEIAKRECTAEEKAKEEGVNLVPELEVQAPAGVKGGGEIVVILKVKNTGTKSTSHADVVGKCPAGVNINVNCGNAFGASVSFRKGDRYGTAVMQRVSAAVTHLGSLLLDSFSSAKAKHVGKSINSGGSLEVMREAVKIPEDFSGKLVITAVVDAEQFYIETRENDNDAFKEVEVQVSSLANLVPTEAEALPAIESLPATVSHVKVAVQNTGERIAIAERNIGGGYVSDPLLIIKASVLQGNIEVCKGEAWETIEAGVKPKEFVRSTIPVRSLANEQCKLEDKDANYWALIDVDTLQVGTVKGVVAESNENDNKQSFQIKGPQTCSPAGAREVTAEKYCSIATGTWLTQKAAGDLCSHNFECKTDLCIGKDSSSKKCISEEKKTKILEIAG